MPHLIDGDVINALNPMEFINVPGAASGSTPFHAISTASDNATVIKASAGCLYGVNVSNSNGAARYLKLYDKATAPTIADTPKMTIYLPATGSINKVFPVGLQFLAGIALRCVTGIADNDAGVTGTDLSIDLDYK
jgi:hypothetical protein